ncbi:MAG: hypothetical protein DMG93_03900 [Acidobacteria bacterium]|nr:MAG: hypothetical protein DMG93_03900 [Acidobacteriota bacterium]
MNGMKVLQKSFLILTGIFFFFVRAGAQTSFPTVSYTQDFEESNPSHYEIIVSNDGQGTYSSNGQLSEKAEPADVAPVQFSISTKVRDQIFDLAKRAKYFDGKVDSGRSNIANTGTKTLTYKDAKRNTKATYNYSPMPAIADLTSVFQNLSTTLEFGRRLIFFHKYQRLALDDELKRMDEMRRDTMLGDVTAIAPILRDIANDQKVMNVSRSRALRLLATVDLAGK